MSRTGEIDQSLQQLCAGGIVIAAEKATMIVETLSALRGGEAWIKLSRGILTSDCDFAIHRWAFEQCYGEHALLRGASPAWIPTADDVAHANITAAAGALGLRDYAAFHRWSTEDPGRFWQFTLERLGILLRQRYTAVMDASVPTRPRWLVGARLNIVDSCFRADRVAPAIVESDGVGAIKTTTYGELRAVASQVARGLMHRNILPGDAVAMISPMSASAIAAYLGIIAAGAAVVSIADSFAAEEIASRLEIAGAKLVITQDFIAWGAKQLPLYEKIKAAAVPMVVMQTQAGSGPLREGDQWFADFLAPAGAGFDPIAANPQDAINILFSSGTTGEPKAIPWDHTTPIKCAMDAHFHHDLHPGDVTCWPTNLGWMMGPWLIFASLINRATIAIFNQAPTGRPFGEFVRDARVTMLGLVPSLLRAWRNSGCMQGVDWSGIKAFSSSGECSNPEDMLYLMHLAGYKPVIEYCGGTEIGGAYITSTLVQPNIPSAFSTAALGIDFQLLDGGKPALSGKTGEVFLKGPSIGLSTRLLNKNHDEVYFPDGAGGSPDAPLRRHGDELEQLSNGYYRVAGRSDDTMNLGGIKVSCAEIERALASIPELLESAAVAVPPAGGGPSQLVIFVVLKPAVSTTPELLKPVMQQAVRSQLNPLFHIQRVIFLPALPRTASNKILRRELRADIRAK